MSSPNASPFDLTPPRRPGLDDYNDIQKVDDAAYPPDPQTQPNAAEWNTIEWIQLAIGRVCPLAVFSATGAGSLTSFAAVRTTLAFGDITVTHVGTGHVTITWPAGTFPTAAVAPMASLNSGPGQVHAVNITNGVDIHTYDGSGSAADRDFTVAIF